MSIMFGIVIWLFYALIVSYIYILTYNYMILRRARVRGDGDNGTYARYALEPTTRAVLTFTGGELVAEKKYRITGVPPLCHTRGKAAWEYADKGDTDLC